MILRSFVKISISEHRYYGEYSCNPLENRLQGITFSILKFSRNYINFISFIIVCTALDIKGQLATNDVLEFSGNSSFFYIQLVFLQCLMCRTSDSPTASEDAGIEPKTAVEFALPIRRVFHA